jgi:ubiquinol-cytochrome c reductase subunit 6
MGFFDSLTDLWEAATPWSTVEAEAVQRGGAGSEKTPADKDNEGEGEAKVCWLHFLLGSWTLFRHYYVFETLKYTLQVLPRQWLLGKWICVLIQTFFAHYLVVNFR